MTWVGAGDWLERACALREDDWLLMDLCGVDARDLGFDHRFEIVVQLVHPADRKRQTVHVAAEGEPPTVPSVTEVWPTANFMEREAYDLFGIAFDGHPNLKRLLLPDEWEGHPLRKDYGVGKVMVEFIPQPFMQFDGPGQSTMQGEADVELDHLGQVKSPPADAEADGGDRSEVSS